MSCTVLSGLMTTRLKMLFNVEKCKVMHIGYDNMKAEYLKGNSTLKKMLA